MAAMLVTCPESGHLEEIEFDCHRLGMLTTRCSRFSGEVTCPRTCAARLDRRQRDAAEVKVGGVLCVRSCLR